MKKVLWVIICCILSLFFFLESDRVYGQLTVTPTPVPVKIDPLTPQDRMTITTLRGIVQSIEALEDQLKQKDTAFKAAETEEQKTTIANEIMTLTTQLNARKRDFEAIAAGVDLDALEAKPKKTFNWQEEVQEIFGPIIEELKGLTARPRELQRLRNEVAYYEKRLPIVRDAIEQTQKRINQATAQKLKRMLGEVKKQWEEREKELNRQLSVVKYQLEEKEKAQRSLVKATQEVLKEFFKSRGRNLILALLAFIFVILSMRYLYRFIYKKAHLDRFGKRPFFLRLAEVIYHTVTVVGAIIALLLVLYVSGDWVLLGLALIFLFGIAWTAKQALPMFWEQIKILLNLGTVREGERVIYRDLPWQVRSLNLYTKLHNPALKGGLIRVPIRELLGIQSRPFYKDEPWFPTREGDLVMLADGGIGTVLMQTPEQVILDTLGGCYKTYATTAFLGLNPINYAINNFGIFVTFGIDYQHQEIITREIPAQLKAFLEEELAKEEYGPDLITLVVQFKEAGASSLDVLIFTSWPGKWASNYFAIGRALQRITVDACNTYGWVIPFNQITVHYGTPPQQEAPVSEQG
jgi:hypothetical protein